MMLLPMRVGWMKHVAQTTNLRTYSNCYLHNFKILNQSSKNRSAKIQQWKSHPPKLKEVAEAVLLLGF